MNPTTTNILSLPFHRSSFCIPRSSSSLYTGQQFDREAALYYYNARYYDPALGRFIQPDTIIPGAADSQAYNRYTYCRNNPIMFTDPTGHWNILRDVKNAIRDVATWVDDNVVQRGKEFVQDNRFVQDALFFSTMGAGAGLSLAFASSFNETRPYVGTAVGIGITVASGGAGSIVGGISGAMISSYLAGGSVQDVAKAGAIGGAVSTATWGIGQGFGDSVIVNEYITQITQSAVGGAVSGAITAAANDGDITKGALAGAAMGAATSSAIGMLQVGVNYFQPKGRSLAIWDSREKDGSLFFAGKEDFQNRLKAFDDVLDISLISNSREFFNAINGKYDSIHFLGYGIPGLQALANRSFDQQGAATAAFWQPLGQHLTSNGRIVLEGCNVARGSVGWSYLQQVAQQSGHNASGSAFYTYSLRTTHYSFVVPGAFRTATP